MTHRVVIQKRNVYGNDLFYPVCDNAKILARIAGRKTLLASDLRDIEALGFEIYTPSPIGHACISAGLLIAT